jgi:hypothetical protein
VCVRSRVETGKDLESGSLSSAENSARRLQCGPEVSPALGDSECSSINVEVELDELKLNFFLVAILQAHPATPDATSALSVGEGLSPWTWPAAAGPHLALQR